MILSKQHFVSSRAAPIDGNRHDALTGPCTADIQDEAHASLLPAPPPPNPTSSSRNAGEASACQRCEHYHCMRPTCGLQNHSQVLQSSSASAAGKCLQPQVSTPVPCHIGCGQYLGGMGTGGGPLPCANSFGSERWRRESRWRRAADAVTAVHTPSSSTAWNVAYGAKQP